jgi:hypothetical protein
LSNFAGPVKPRPHRPYGYLKRGRDLLVAEFGEGVEEQRVSLAWTHRRKSRCQASVKSRTVGAGGRLVLVGDPAVDATTPVSAQPAALSPPTTAEQVGGDPKQPGKRAVARTEGRPPLERKSESLSRKLISKIATAAAVEVPMHSGEVSVEDQLERLRLPKREFNAVGIGRNLLHHSVLARSQRSGFNAGRCAETRCRGSGKTREHPKPGRIDELVDHRTMAASLRARVTRGRVCFDDHQQPWEAGMSRKAWIAAIVLIAVAALTTTGAISASAADDDSSANALVGSWQLNVNRGPVLPPVKGLTTYTSGGSLIGTANTVVRGPAHGTWERVSGRLYADTHIFFRFDASGTFIGTQKIKENVQLSQDGDSYTAVAISDLFDPNGNLVAGGLRATITATRIKVERIPDMP